MGPGSTPGRRVEGARLATAVDCPLRRPLLKLAIKSSGSTPKAWHSGRNSMRDVFICDAVRTPIGRFGGSLAKVRADDLAAVPIKALMARDPKLDWAAVDEVYFGCANQAGEDNRNVARMALLLAGLPESVPGLTLNRLCASGLDAVGAAGRAIRAGEIELALAGGG